MYNRKYKNNDYQENGSNNKSYRNGHYHKQQEEEVYYQRKNQQLNYKEDRRNFDKFAENEITYVPKQNSQNNGNLNTEEHTKPSIQKIEASSENNGKESTATTVDQSIKTKETKEENKIENQGFKKQKNHTYQESALETKDNGHKRENHKKKNPKDHENQGTDQDFENNQRPKRDSFKKEQNHKPRRNEKINKEEKNNKKFDDRHQDSNNFPVQEKEQKQKGSLNKSEKRAQYQEIIYERKESALPKQNQEQQNERESPLENQEMIQQKEKIYPGEEFDEESLTELTASLFEAASNIPGYNEGLNPPKVKHQAKYDQNPELKDFQEDSKKKSRKDKENTKDEQTERNNEQKKRPKKNPLQWAIEKFYKQYHYNKIYSELFKRLEETWEEMNQAFEEENKTFEFLLKTKPFFFNNYTSFAILFFHLLLEKGLFDLALELYNEKFDLFSKASSFIDLIEQAVSDLNNPKNKKAFQAYQIFKETPKFSNRATLNNFGRSKEDTILMEKFEKFGKKFLRIEALEKIKKEDKIAIYFEYNPHLESYFSVLQIATANEIVILDLQRLCQFQDNLLTLVEFFTIILGKKSSTIITMNSTNLCDILINSLYIENEEKDKEFVAAKKELCKTLDRYHINFTDMSTLGMGRNIRELMSNVLKLDLDEREKFGNWYKRPLSKAQIALSEINVSSLYACYEELFEKD